MGYLIQDERTLIKNEVYQEVVNFLDEVFQQKKKDVQAAHDAYDNVKKGSFCGGISDEDEDEIRKNTAWLELKRVQSMMDTYNYLADYFWKKIQRPQSDHLPLENEILGME